MTTRPRADRLGRRRRHGHDLGRASRGRRRAAHRPVDRRSRPRSGESPGRPRTSWLPQATSGWPRPTTEASSTTCSRHIWGSPRTTTCARTAHRSRLGLGVPLGEIDRAKLNVNGSSLAAGHPFAATSGRIVASTAKLLHEKGSGRALISICAAGGNGVVAILEATNSNTEAVLLRGAIAPIS